MQLYGCFQKLWYPQIINYHRVFPYKPSILGYPYYWKHPYIGDIIRYNKAMIYKEPYEPIRIINGSCQTLLTYDVFFWVVVSNIFYFPPYLGKIPILTNIFQRG